MTDTEFQGFCKRVVIAENGCLEWIAGKNNGYGHATFGDKRDYAHRVSYEYFIGEIPENMEIDHLCRNRACVNPIHLEVVTMIENVMRGMGPSAINSRKTHCDKGHEYTGNNLIVDSQGARQCRICRNERWLRNFYKRRGIK